MPDSQGRFVGLGWTQRSADAWARVFGVPAEPSREVFSARALARLSEPLAGGVKMGDELYFDDPQEWYNAEEGRDPEEEADHQAARDGFNPEW